jgi:hypothetical protein
MQRRVASQRVEAAAPTVLGAPRPRRSRPRKVVVAIVDGGAADAEVVDYALESCVSRARTLRLVHLYGEVDRAPTPLAEEFAREYTRGAMSLARLVPGVAASAVSIPWVAAGALRPELADADTLIASIARSAQVVDAGRPVRAAGLRYHFVAAATGAAHPDRLRFAYRIALERELARACDRADGATTAEALDDAWHVGIACPELTAETICAWAACLAWPPHSVHALAGAGARGAYALT